MALKPEDALREWKSGKFRPVYYFFGEQAAAKADALLALKTAFKADDFNFREFTGDFGSEVDEIVSEAMTLPPFGGGRLVIARSPKIPAEAKARLIEYLIDPTAGVTLVLLSDEPRPDRKDALAAAAEKAGAVVSFSPLTEEEAVERLVAQARQAGKTLAPEAAAAIVEEAGTDWGVLSGELEKAVLFAGKSATIGLEAVSACLGAGDERLDPWAFEKLAQGRDLKACLGYLAEAYDRAKPDEVTFRSLAQIRGGFLKQLKAKRLLKAGLPQREIETRLRIFYDSNFFARAQRVTEARLRRDLRRCLEVETDLKSKTWLDSKLELERFVVELCAPSAPRP